MKKTIYIISWVVLGLILSFILHAGIEMLYIKYVNPADLKWVTVFGGSCFLPVWLIYLLPILGIIFGLWAGIFFWKMVYTRRGLK